MNLETLLPFSGFLFLIYKREIQSLFKDKMAPWFSQRMESVRPWDKEARSPSGWVMSKLEEQRGTAHTSYTTRPGEADTRDKASLYGQQTIFPL